MALTAQEIIAKLGLQPLPGEGGFYRETYRAAEQIPPGALPDRYGAARPREHSTQIYFLLTRSAPSLMHVVQSDEVFHHYLGDAVEQLQITPDGAARALHIGPALDSGQRPQVVVPRGVWQGCRVLPEASRLGYALLGCTVAPGFDWDDFRLGSRADMRALCAGADARVSELIDALTPPAD